MPGESEASTISERGIKRDASEKEEDVQAVAAKTARKQKTRTMQTPFISEDADLFTLIVPYLTMQTRRLMICDNSTQCKIHNARCYECVERRGNHKSAETFEACSECKILRAVILVSRRWNQVTWNQRCLRPDSIPFSESYISFLERKPNATEEERMAFLDARDPDWKICQPQIPGLVWSQEPWEADSIFIKSMTLLHSTVLN